MDALRVALNHMNMTELKDECRSLGIRPTGRKGEIINGILGFVRGRKKPVANSIPHNCQAQAQGVYPLKKQTLILCGSYKNNDATRDFLKSVVGPHFHFTAFGQDWIRRQWAKGKPPTYAEFARAWQQEHLRRRSGEVARPKKEWAYLNFVQRFGRENPAIDRNQLASEWKKQRAAQAALAHRILGTFKGEGK
jgi:hypothetical protein